MQRICGGCVVSSQLIQISQTFLKPNTALCLYPLLFCHQQLVNKVRCSHKNLYVTAKQTYTAYSKVQYGATICIAKHHIEAQPEWKVYHLQRNLCMLWICTQNMEQCIYRGKNAEITQFWKSGTLHSVHWPFNILGTQLKTATKVLKISRNLLLLGVLMWIKLLILNIPPTNELMKNYKSCGSTKALLPNSN